jgi:glucose-1-phosphate thymidylyltransferase
MKGVILAGGTGSRLYPLTKVTNKHLLPVGKYPMIYYSIAKLRDAGIKEILIVTGKDHMGDVVQLLGSGRHLGVALTYRVQDAAGGIAQALDLAESFAAGNDIAVILGDNVFQDDIIAPVQEFKSGAKIFLKEVTDPQRFGVPEIQGSLITSIEEKPSSPKSNYAVTGVYLYDSKVFNIIKTIKPSGRGELEITDVNNAYIEIKEMSYNLLSGWWTDAGTHESLSRASQLCKNAYLGEDFDAI